MKIVKAIFLLVVASCVACQQLPLNYNSRSVAGAGAGICPDTQDHVEQIRQGIDSLFESVVLPTLNRPCICGGPGWRRAAYLNMSDPTQTCPPAWELITTPRRSCARPSSAGYNSCNYIQLCSLLKAFRTLRSVEESLDIRLDNHKLSVLVKTALLMVAMLME